MNRPKSSFIEEEDGGGTTLCSTIWLCCSFYVFHMLRRRVIISRLKFHFSLRIVDGATCNYTHTPQPTNALGLHKGALSKALLIFSGVSSSFTSFSDDLKTFFRAYLKVSQGLFLDTFLVIFW